LPSHTASPGKDELGFSDRGPKNQPEDQQKVPLLTQETYDQGQTYQKCESEYFYEFTFRTEDTCVPRDLEVCACSEGVRVTLAKVASVPATGQTKKTHTKQEQKHGEDLVAMDPCMGQHGIPSKEVTVPPKENIQTMTIPVELRKKLGQTHFCFPLPPDANAHHARVNYSQEDGVISISVPKVVRMLELMFN